MSNTHKSTKIKIILAVVAIFIVYSLLGRSSSLPAFERKYGGDVIAEVNGKDIREEEIRERLDFITGGKGASINLANIDNEGLKAIAKEVYVQRLVLDEALDSDIMKDKEFKNKVAGLVQTVYKEKFLENVAKKGINDKNIKTTYDELVSKAKNSKQYKVRHALFKSEDEAKAARAKIIDGSATLEEVAKQSSADKLSAAKGGDLGYIFPDEFVKEFAFAVKTAERGEISQPVKTEFGYHLIKVEDSKPAQIVPFDQAKPRIEKQLGSDAVRAYVDSISKDLKIEVVKKPEPRPQDKAAAAAQAPAKAAPAAGSK